MEEKKKKKKTTTTRERGGLDHDDGANNNNNNNNNNDGGVYDDDVYDDEVEERRRKNLIAETSYLTSVLNAPSASETPPRNDDDGDSAYAYDFGVTSAVYSLFGYASEETNGGSSGGCGS